MIINFFKILIIISSTSLCLNANDIICVEAISPSCYQGNNGKLQITGIKENISITVEVFNDSTLRNNITRQIISNTEITIIDNLEAGYYYITYTYNSLLRTLKIKIDDPKKLESGLITVKKNSKSETILQANPTGGTRPYSYLWKPNIKNNRLDNIEVNQPGIYTCTINDSNNCGEITSTIFFVNENYPEIFKN